MKLRYRRIIFYITLAIFIIGAPALVLLTAGYQYQHQRHRLVELGVVIVEVRQRGAKVFINDELRGDAAQWRALLPPDRYMLRIEAPNYKPWVSPISVLAGQTTIVRDPIILPDAPVTLLSDIPMLTITKAPTNFLETPRLLAIATKSDKYLSLYSLAASTSALNTLTLATWSIPTDWQTATSSILPSPSGNYALVTSVLADGTTVPLLATTDNRKSPRALTPQWLAAQQKEGITRMHWRDNDALLVTTTKHLWHIDVTGNLAIALTSEPPTDAIVSDRALFTMSTPTNGTTLLERWPIADVLAERDKRFMQTADAQWQIPGSYEHFIPSPSGVITLVGQRGLVLVRTDGTIIAATNGTTGAWRDNPTTMLTSNGIELNTVNPRGTGELIGRYGETIDAIDWLNGRSGIAIVQEGILKLIDESAYPDRPVATVTGIDHVRTLISVGGGVVVLGSLANVPGVYFVPINQ